MQMANALNVEDAFQAQMLLMTMQKMKRSKSISVNLKMNRFFYGAIFQVHNKVLTEMLLRGLPHLSNYYSPYHNGDFASVAHSDHQTLDWDLRALTT
jgi:hypothetical protein